MESQGYTDDDCAANEGAFTPEALRRHSLGKAEYVYPLLELSGRSLLAVLCARARLMEDCWFNFLVRQRGRRWLLFYFGGNTLKDSQHRGVNLR